jgi:hypothetical protein
LQFSTTEVQKLQTKLKEIDASMTNGKFVDAEGKEYRGSGAVSELLKRCLAWSDIVLERYVICIHDYCIILSDTLPGKE